MEGIAYDDVALSRTYHRFAELEAAAQSPTYHRLCLGIAEDPQLLDLIAGLPTAKRQPNLLLAAARWHGAPLHGYPAFREWLAGSWDAVSATMLARSTQTNEPARMATLLPTLAQLSNRPLALLEVGASAGLCLYPDRFGYDYDGGPGRGHLTLGRRDAPVTFNCAVTGNGAMPMRVPDIVWRAGIDLNPLDARDPDTVRWLECLIWPEHDWRLPGLHAAINAARAQPPLLAAGDLNDRLDAVLAQAPTDVTLVVFHTAVLAYLDEAGKDRFTARMARLVRERDAHWISNEAPAVLPAIAARLFRPAPAGRFVLSHNGAPVAFTAPHGQALDWL
jgi:hypothetical protein